MRQSILLKILIVFAGVAAVGGVMLFARKSGLPPSNTAPSSIPTLTPSSFVTTAPQPSISTSNPDTINWKIYKNEEYGYAVQYPPTWKFYEISPRTVTIHSGETGVSDIGIIMILENTNISKAINDHIARYAEGTRIQHEEQAMISGEQAHVIYLNIGGKDLPNDSEELAKYVFIPHGKNIHKLGIFATSQDLEIPFDRMLSTFIFTK